MNVTIRFDSGPPTRLENHPHLAARVALLGAPTRVRRLGSARLVAEWDLPGRVESHVFGNPWPMDRRAVVALEVERDAFDAVRNWLIGLRCEAVRRVFEAERELKALREAFRAVETRAGVPDKRCGEVGCSYCDSDNA